MRAFDTPPASATPPHERTTAYFMTKARSGAPGFVTLNAWHATVCGAYQARRLPVVAIVMVPIVVRSVAVIGVSRTVVVVARSVIAVAGAVRTIIGMACGDRAGGQRAGRETKRKARTDAARLRRGPPRWWRARRRCPELPKSFSCAVPPLLGHREITRETPRWFQGWQREGFRTADGNRPVIVQKNPRRPEQKRALRIFAVVGEARAPRTPVGIRRCRRGFSTRGAQTSASLFNVAWKLTLRFPPTSVVPKTSAWSSANVPENPLVASCPPKSGRTKRSGKSVC